MVISMLGGPRGATGMKVLGTQTIGKFL